MEKIKTRCLEIYFKKIENRYSTGEQIKGHFTNRLFLCVEWNGRKLEVEIEKFFRDAMRFSGFSPSLLTEGTLTPKRLAAIKATMPKEIEVLVYSSRFDEDKYYIDEKILWEWYDTAKRKFPNTHYKYRDRRR